MISEETVTVDELNKALKDVWRESRIYTLEEVLKVIEEALTPGIAERKIRTLLEKEKGK